MLSSNLDVSEMFVERQAQRGSMHARHLNEQMVRVLKTIGYDVGFQKGKGQYLFDRDDVRYLDLLSGFGVFAIGRNHPALRAALKSVLDSDLPNLVQLDVSTLAGRCGERVMSRTKRPPPRTRFAPPSSILAFSTAGFDHGKFVGAKASRMFIAANRACRSVRQSSPASEIS